MTRNGIDNAQLLPHAEAVASHLLAKRTDSGIGKLLLKGNDDGKLGVKSIALTKAAKDSAPEGSIQHVFMRVQPIAPDRHDLTSKEDKILY
jgi:hypothetical protein